MKIEQTKEVVDTLVELSETIEKTNNELPVNDRYISTNRQKSAKSLPKQPKMILVDSMLLEKFEKYLVKKKSKVGIPACGYSRGQRELILQILNRFKKIKKGDWVSS